MCFVAQRSGMEHIGPFAFNGIRQLLGAVTLLVVLGCMLVFRKVRRQRALVAGGVRALVADVLPQSPFKSARRTVMLKGGVICGCVLYVASNLQQIGMVTTVASKAGFITTLYIVLVPLLGIAFRHKTRWNTWASVALAVAGLFLLCISEAFSVAPGDAILLASALFWALHILFVDRYVATLLQDEVVLLCVIQFSVCSLLSLLSMPLDSLFVTVPDMLAAVFGSALEIAYAGVLSTGVAFTLAAIGQKYANPSAAAVVMSLESVFGLLGGVVLLGEMLSGREATGCVVMFAAVMLAQLPMTRRQKE
jgi:drug/metabolite transporter (DMT)-like permease